jgi:hypothetical protein
MTPVAGGMGVSDLSAKTEVGGLVTSSSDFPSALTDPEHDLDHAAGGHDRRSGQIADEQRRATGAATDQRPVDRRSARAGDLGDRENTAIASARISIGHVSETVR